MIEVQQIADFLNTELNNIGKSQGYNFDIKAEVGKRTNKDAIYGIVTTTKADARVDENVDYVFAVELSVPSAQTNENVIKVEKIIGEFKNKFHMKNRAFGGGQGTLSIGLATPKDYQIKYVVGDDVPLVFSISTTFIRNAVGSGDKHWLLNGMEIPFINESVSVQKEGRTNTIHGESYTKTLLTRQTRYYKFGFDYDNSKLCIMLKKDLLDGKYDKVYTLTYYDGVSFTQENPFTTSVSIFANGVSSSNKPNVSEFDITFTDVDNEVKATYEMALIDNPFDSTTENTMYFETEEKQRDYYQKKIDKDIRYPGGVGCMFVKIKAPNLSSIDLTNQVYEIPLNDGEPIYDVLSVTNKNYAIIKVKKGEDEQWFYYYVSNQNIGGQNQVMFDLKLDSLQTYYIGDKLQFGNCLIEKGHENRWIDNGDGTVSFDGTIDSRLFEREDIQNVAKRMTKRTSISLYPDTKIGNWFKDNVLAWLYLYVDPTHQFKGKYKNYADVTNIKIPNISNYSKKGGSLPSNIGVIAFPITLANLKLSVYHGDNSYPRPWAIPASASATYTSFYYFINSNEGYKYIYATKISAYPPVINWDVEYTINDYDKTLTIQTPKGDEYFINNPLFPMLNLNGYGGNSFLTDLIDDYGVVSIIGSQENGIDLNYKVNKQLKFNKNEIINSNKNSKYNPKLLSSDYFNLRISDHTENGFDYDLQKINKNQIEIKYTEALVPDMAKKYIRIINLNGVYIPETADNLTGFVDNNDNSIIMPTTAFQDMLANNKNFFLQNSINRSLDATRGAFSTARSTLQNASSGNVGNTISSFASGAVNIGMNYAQSKINENLTVDNLKNAPAQIIGAKGNPIFEHMYSETGVIVEEWDILPNEKEIINDYMCKYGFTVNRFGNPKDYDNIRHYYNYVKAQIDSISGIAISNQARDDIRQRFANGVRFWKQDNIDYSMENYEEWLAQ